MKNDTPPNRSSSTIALDPGPGTSRPRILIVDDNRDIVTLTERILRQLDFETRAAGDGEAALHAVTEFEPDVVLLDVMLPQMDGLEVCRRLKSDPQLRRIMVLLITGCGSVDHRVKGLEAGADDYITKPFHVTELQARVRSALRIKRLNDEIEAKHRELLEAQKERLRAEKMATIGLLATGIAHEFNNIMSGICGFAELARRNDSYKDQLIDVTLAQARRAMQIANSLSTFYRPSGGKTRTNLGEVVQNSLCLVAKPLKQRRIELETHLEEGVEAMAHAGQIQEVVLNLTLNAIQAIGEEGRIRIDLGRREDGQVELSVRDSGPGIAEDIREKIFDPFFTTKGALGGGDMSGSGLGLSVSYNIVRSHRGQLIADNLPEGGAIFRVVLPALAPCEAHEEGSASATTWSGPVPRVLVGDPDSSIQEIAEKYLKGDGDAPCCSSWEELFERLEADPVDAILLDTSLPGPEPFETCYEKLLREHPDLPIVITSKSFSAPAVRECLPRARAHLLKPYTMENLADVIGDSRSEA